ncbi:MAG: SUMF1/EgtB/PvdO family nonheme iron enzyme [Planctomycetota bacterium]
MSREYWERVESFRKRFWRDVQGGEVRDRREYLDEFPEFGAEIDAELAGLCETLMFSGSNSVEKSCSPEPGAHSSRDQSGGHAGAPWEGRIGRYVLEEELGRGGQGVVYRARDLKIGLEVALKVLRLSHVMSVEAKLRLKGEAEKAAKLNHPNVARVHEWGEEGGFAYIAMEFVRGETLAVHIRDSVRAAEADPKISELFSASEGIGTSAALSTTRGPDGPNQDPPPSTGAISRGAMFEIAALIESAARGLHEAHERGLVHRDIKPDNLMVTEDRGLVVLDFGLARDDEADGPSLTMTGDVLGTPAYMSPEQLAAKRVRVDRRSDVYSLGVTLVECLVLRRPFIAPSREALFQEIIAREAPDVRRLNRKVPYDLSIIVQHALSKHPDQRYQSALDLAEDLRRFCEHQPIIARRVGPLTRTWRWAQRRPVTAGLLATIFLALLAFAIVKNRDSERLAQLNRELEATNQQLEERRREASRSVERANASERRATSEARAKADALASYQRMADIPLLANARARAERLWPDHPDRVSDLEAWQREFAPLFERLEGHRKALDLLRARALEYSDDDRRRDGSEGLARLRRAEAALREAKGGPAASRIESDVRRLREEIGARKTWDFGSKLDLQFQHDNLARLVGDLQAFTDDVTGVTRSVARRVERSQRIRKETLEDHADRWRAAIARIGESGRYGKMEIQPQLGLIPLGPDPESGLEEFLDWRTHDRAEHIEDISRREGDGRITMTSRRGLIFVLIPGGAFFMGAQGDPTKPNSESKFEPDESPVRKITLAPYFMSKYEMTRNQWERFDRPAPAVVDADPLSAAESALAAGSCHPVAYVSWRECTERLHHLGLELPTEAQWERAARGDDGTSAIWAGTSTLGDLHRFANIAGKEASEFYRRDFEKDHIDHHEKAAPVGSYLPSSYGLHDMSGNVWEWCRDSHEDYALDPRSGDGLRTGDSPQRINRGGSFGNLARHARVALRGCPDPSTQIALFGVRPSRSLD